MFFVGLGPLEFGVSAFSGLGIRVWGLGLRVRQHRFKPENKNEFAAGGFALRASSPSV